MNIHTELDRPAWIAVDTDTYEPDQLIGRGASEQEAIASLMGQMGATCKEVAEELAGRGFTDGQIAKLMNTPIQGKPAPVTLAIN